MGKREQQQEARQFLNTLYATKPEVAAIQIWLRAKRNTTWFSNTIDGAAALAIEHRSSSDVYVACGLAPKAHEKPQRHRLKAGEIVGIPGVWADIDVNGGPEAKDGAAPTRDAALELASSMLEPTIVVNSGYGIQAWWCLEEVLMFPTHAEQDQAKRVVAGYQGALRAAARRLGWGLDATQDLSRVLRVPGTLNHKDAENPQEVTILAVNEKARYPIEEIAELGQYHAAAQPSPDDRDVQVEVRQHAVDPRVNMLKLDEPEFKQLWDMQTTRGGKRGNWSPSEYEMAIANWLVKAGLDDQQLCDALVAWRHEIEPGDPRGRCRVERIAKTISRVRATSQIEQEQELEQREQEAALERLQAIVKGKEEANEAKTVGLLSQVIKGPEIARLKQFSRDPAKARFAIELADGRTVELGPFSNISNQRLFRDAYAIATGYYPPTIKQPKWDTAVGAMLLTAVVLDEIEDSRAGEMIDWLDSYIEECRCAERDEACQTIAPFIENERLHVPLNDFVRYLKVMGERPERADVRLVLRSLGFSRVTIAYTARDGSRTSRSVFVAELPLREPPYRGDK